MGMLNKIRWGIIGLVGLGAAGFAGYTYVSGAGEIHVKAPQETGVSVVVDGKEVATLAAGTHQRLKIDQGKHTVQIKLSEGDGEATHEVDVDSGFYEALIPGPQQCFADFDVYDTFYGKADPPPVPGVEGTHGADKPISITSNHYFSEDALPNEIKEGSDVNLLEQIPCELVGKSDDEVRSATGFTQENLSRVR